MSFKSAMRGTQLNQHYRQNNAQLQNIDRDMRDDRFAFNDKENKRGNMIEAFGSAVKGIGTLGGELTNMDKNIQFGKKHGLESGGLMNMINPFKKGGFGQTYSKGDGPNMTVDDLGKTRGVMDWSQARMGPDAFSFGDASEMMMSDNPMQTLLGRYNSWKNKPVKEKVNKGIEMRTKELDPDLDYATDYQGDSMTEDEWNAKQAQSNVSGNPFLRFDESGVPYGI